MSSSKKSSKAKKKIAKKKPIVTKTKVSKVDIPIEVFKPILDNEHVREELMHPLPAERVHLVIVDSMKGAIAELPIPKTVFQRLKDYIYSF